MPDTSSSVECILQRAQRLQVELSKSERPIHSTWLELCRIVESGCRLGELTRHPKLEELYTKEFNPLIKKKFGTVEKYLKDLLSFDTNKGEDRWWTCPGSETSTSSSSQARVRLNDWGYSIPKEVQHFVVWVNLPLFHRQLCQDQNTWEFVQENGVSGLTSQRGDEEVRGPGKEIEKFVRNYWPEQDSFETCWFANPPRLQSVPGLSHFHVLVRKKQ